MAEAIDLRKYVDKATADRILDACDTYGYFLFTWLFINLRDRCGSGFWCKPTEKYIGLWSHDRIFAWIVSQSRMGGLKVNVASSQIGFDLHLLKHQHWSTRIESAFRISGESEEVLRFLEHCYKRETQ